MNEDPEIGPSIAPRRWFQFRLRTLFIAVAVLAVSMARVGYSLDWIRQRKAHLVSPNRGFTDQCLSPQTQRAPAGLWLFGEQGYIAITATPDQEGKARRLFPEALVFLLAEAEP